MKRARKAKNVKKPGGVFEQVFNEAGERVRGLWKRFGVFHAQMDAKDGIQYQYKLEHAKTLPQAVLARQALKVKQKTEGGLPPPSELKKNEPKERPSTADTSPSGPALKVVIAKYQSDRDVLKKKDAATAAREDSGLRKWEEKFGDACILTIKFQQLSDFAKWRMKDHEVNGGTVDRNILSLGHVFQFARNMELIPKDHPKWTWKKLAQPPAKDELLTPEQMDELCNAAFLDPEEKSIARKSQAASAQAFHDYLRLLQHSGAREHETCVQRWPNVTWSRLAKHDGDGGEFKQGEKVPGNLFFPGKFAKAGGGKPAEDRAVDFHPSLEEHLKDMYKRRNKESEYLFPGEAPGQPLNRFYKPMDRIKAKLRAKWELTAKAEEIEKDMWFDNVTFQWFRHYFISHAVMAYIDFKTIAYWVSHRDGGILIGRLYGHLDKRHGRAMAAKLATHLHSRR